ncbi:prolyl hydroxylase family protein [Acanthopleuribacter pedis]|uniref:2OG-Fe(II) oxygenase n=1 Tax=Acanthopleuribacter pedis TaxID=442870 RepID=A0A8J7QL27_9BACT|nr:2OG-Fe(II) oxygenase [Acanthopleuribacter pedis]MBO1321875.1 2OG-Fe(II) oxygenase [Acanthopleuribacter pedis]
MIPIPMRFDAFPLLWTLDDVYSPAECARIIADINASELKPAGKNPNYRNQDRVMRDDPAAAEDLFQRLRSRIPKQMGPLSLVGLNERLRYYRYAPGQGFAPHVDHWFRPNPRQITLLTVLVYFNDDFTGGETHFEEQLTETEQFLKTVEPKPGRVAIFQHMVTHEGRPVRSGYKYAMRTDVVYEGDAEIGQISY